jgi:uncharacterized protein YndB with AHSA1/START domain
MDTNQIRKEVVLKASRERVWRAISEAKQFGSWFGATIDGPFVAGKEAAGRIAPTKADPEVARLQEPYAGFPWRIVVERIEPMTLFSFRWHPHAVDPNHDYSNEPMTLVTFELAEVAGGILLTITETGFDQIPLARRAQAIESNSRGWTHQTKLIEKYLALQQHI